MRTFHPMRCGACGRCGPVRRRSIREHKLNAPAASGPPYSPTRAARAGPAPLDQPTQVEFDARCGIAILIDYGAAEFIGGVAGWTLDDHRRFGASKRGRGGRARAE